MEVVLNLLRLSDCLREVCLKYFAERLYIYDRQKIRRNLHCIKVISFFPCFLILIKRENETYWKQ